MNYEELVIDFADRTMANLAFIRAAKDAGGDVYEVTQLWNSLLGLVVALPGRHRDRLPLTSLDEMHAAGWPNITTSGRLRQENLRGLITYLRNAVAHFNVEFLDRDRTGQITSVRIWTCPNPLSPDADWEGEMTVDELDKLARHLALSWRETLARGVA